MGKRPFDKSRGCPGRKRHVPTGFAISDARDLLFDAAERVLLRDGPSALTSRSVTTEAGCAKGVLHRNFADFDAFLAELVEDRVAKLDDLGVRLRGSAGTGTVVGNLTVALTDLFSSVAVAIVALLVFRDDLRSRLRRSRPAGVPLLTEATALIADYLLLERERGRLPAGADVDVLAPTLIGAVHLLFADRKGDPPDEESVRRVVATVVG
jgi:AcrR family transcriptional regulator